MPDLAEPQEEDGRQLALYFPPNTTLKDLAGGQRFTSMDRHEAFYENRQDRDKAYSWDGYFHGYGEEASIKPGWYVPLSKRRPATTMPLARMIVSRLNSMLFGVQNRPDVLVAGDENAEAFVREVAKESSLWQRMIEARKIGGSSGTVAMSYGYNEGKPRVEVHRGKHCRVLAWQDFPEKIPNVVMKSYEYTKEVFDPESGKAKEKVFFYVRYWDNEVEVIWEQIPEKVAKTSGWMNVSIPDRVIWHDTGWCPVVWIQNTSNSEDDDGDADYVGSLDDMDQINRLKSASCKGTIANVDPTLVVKQDATKNHGSVRKGSENAIFSAGGAEYLELQGSSISAAEQKLDSLRQDVLDAAQVILPTPETVTGSVQSAAALRILFAPMTSRCDTLREQYGDRGIVRILTGLLRQAKADGVEVNLEPKVDTQTDEEGNQSTNLIEHSPGEREVIALVWPPYFPATWTDRQAAAQTASAAAGQKAILSQRTAIQSVAQLFGVEDVDAELANIKSEADASLEAEAKALAMLAPSSFEEEEEEPEEEADE